MKSIDRIPTTKIERAAKLIQTGAKIGVNYLKFYGEKITSDELNAKKNLDQNNATDIYDGLKQLKGSALKVIQMLSMEKSMLPKAYVDKFSLAQFSVPPLSAPLVNKTFKKYFGKMPQEIFDRFDANAINAASIGQVHLAELNGKKLAVKIQYPGVATSISSDLALVKPIATKMFHIKTKDAAPYFKEVEDKLLEETDYTREINQSIAIVNACKHLKNIRFPSYYPEWSSEKIITMDWMQGIHLSEFTQQNTHAERANLLGQTLWDFYMFQLHSLKKVHADPHPGNFLVNSQFELIALDFGCVKEIPEEFYYPYFQIMKTENLENKSFFTEKLYELEILRADDSAQEITFFTDMFHQLLSLFSKPFQQASFDFSDEQFFQQLAEMGEKYTKLSNVKGLNTNRGSKHFIYINRTFFGLYYLLHDLKAKNIVTNG